MDEHSRQQANSESTNNSAYDHDSKPGGKGLNGTSNRKYDGAYEECALATQDIAYLASSEGGYCDKGSDIAGILRTECADPRLQVLIQLPWYRFRQQMGC